MKSFKKEKVSCCIKTCTSTKKDGLSFHCFPNKITENDRRMKWIKILRIINLNDKTRICSLHFTENSFYPTSL